MPCCAYCMKKPEFASVGTGHLADVQPPSSLYKSSSLQNNACLVEATSDGDVIPDQGPGSGP